MLSADVAPGVTLPAVNLMSAWENEGSSLRPVLALR
jgi:hypothetical protein